MPQEHYVLKCFSCETFQAHIVKISKKWECKICGTKQSLKRNYGKGSGKECRIQVMRLNELQLRKNNGLYPMKSETVDDKFMEDLNEQQVMEQLQIEKPLTSKWAEYLEENTADNDNDSDKSETDFFLDSNGKKKRQMKKKIENCCFKKKKTYTDYKKKNVFSQKCEEIVKKNDFPSPSVNQSFDSSKRKEQELKKYCSDQCKNELKPSKYTKFLEEQENENIKVVKKIANIFDSDTSDLDNLLNF